MPRLQDILIAHTTTNKIQPLHFDYSLTHTCSFVLMHFQAFIFPQFTHTHTPAEAGNGGGGSGGRVDKEAAASTRQLPAAAAASYPFFGLSSTAILVVS